MKIISILGPPGAGKSTLCMKIKQEYKCKHISTGELVRNAGNQDLLDILNDGNLIPSEIIVDMLVKKINKISGNYDFILLDGFPRSIQHLECFERYGNTIDLIVNLVLGEDAVYERVLNRCDERTDNLQYIIKQRLDVYNAKTLSLLNNTKIKKIDLNASLDREAIYAAFKIIYHQ